MTEGPVGAAVRSLAATALDGNQLVRLSRTINRLRAGNKDLAPLAPFKLGLVSNSTTDFLIAPIIASAARVGLLVEVVAAHYDQVLQSALDPASAINVARCRNCSLRSSPTSVSSATSSPP